MLFPVLSLLSVESKLFYILGLIMFQLPSSVPRSVVLQAFCPPLFQSADQDRLNILCPFWALSIYVHHSGQWRKSEQLFVCFGSRSRGSAVVIVQAISEAYGVCEIPSIFNISSSILVLRVLRFLLFKFVTSLEQASFQ